jgi:hypothetical protein
MTNINCSENCTYSINGKCTFTQPAAFSSSLNPYNSCGYYVPKEILKKEAVASTK